jgi:putative ABC transport system permease protein
MFLNLAIRNLFRNPRRTILVLLTVAMGTGSLFMFHGFNGGIMNQYKENTIHARYGHGQIHTNGYWSQVFEKPWEHWITNFEELKADLLKIEGVQQVFPRIQSFALLTNGKITVSGRFQGIDGPEEFGFFNSLNIEEGKNLSNEKDGVILGKGLAKALDANVGDRITVLSNTIYGSMNAVDLTVTGVFHTGAKEFDDVVFRIPIEQAFMLLDTRKVESIALGLTSTKSWGNVASAIRTNHTHLEAIPFATLDKVYYQHSVDWLNSQFGFIQLIILAIVILGIFNTVSTSILERKQEIGNLRANGESSTDILKLLSLEGLSLGIIGAALGILFIWLLNVSVLANGILMPPAPGLTRQFFVRIELQWSMAFMTFTMGAFCAMFGTVMAALKVVKMNIADALRAV